ncbi:hypothetical protein T484DRAFT_1810487 [Baffinella frigidus]|nr:hypothetical protein T484DRAFT_1810487 [Cryptophyta sp. CCMP2293]
MRGAVVAFGAVCVISSTVEAFVGPIGSLGSARLALLGRSGGLPAGGRCAQRAGFALQASGAVGDDGDAPMTRTMKSKALPLYVQDVMTHVSSTGAVLDAGKGLTFKGVTSSTKNSYKDTSKHTVLKTELYVRGLPWDLDNDGLKDIFKEFTPKHARVMKQKDTLRPLGFGFVGFPNADLAAKAMAKLDGSTMPGRTHEYSGQEIPGPRLGITLANSKTTKTRTLASKEGKFTQAMMIGQRKAELAARDMNKVVTGPEGMPRRWKIINDKAPSSTLPHLPPLPPISYLTRALATSAPPGHAPQNYQGALLALLHRRLGGGWLSDAVRVEQNPEVTREGLARFSEAQEEEETVPSPPRVNPPPTFSA